MLGSSNKTLKKRERDFKELPEMYSKSFTSSSLVDSL